MHESVLKVLEYLQPIVEDLEDVKNKLLEITNKKDSVDDLILYVNDDITDFKGYTNQDLIFSILEEFSYDKELYEAYNYLLNSMDVDITKLPQYNDATSYMNNLLANIKYLSYELETKKNELNELYNYKLRADKYIKIFNKDIVIIHEIDDYINFVKEYLPFESSIKIYLLKLIIKNNINYYGNIYNDEHNSDVDPNQDLNEINTLIHENKYLLDDKYLPLVNELAQRVDLNNRIEDILLSDLAANVNVKNIFLAKKVFLIHHIVSCYKSCEFSKVSKYVKGLKKVKDLQKKVNDKDIDEIKRIIREGK